MDVSTDRATKCRQPNVVASSNTIHRTHKRLELNLMECQQKLATVALVTNRCAQLRCSVSHLIKPKSVKLFSSIWNKLIRDGPNFFDEHFPWGTYVGRWGRDIHIRADDRVRVAVFGEIWQRNNCRCEDPSCPKFWKTKWCEKVSVQVVAVSTGGIITGVVLSQLNSDPNVGPDHGLVYFPYASSKRIKD